MPDYPDALLKEILIRTRTIALVGASADPARPSHSVGLYLAGCGYRVIPVNPGLAGKVLFGQPVRASLSQIDEPVDMVDIFRRPDAVPGVVEEALRVLPGLSTIWMQLGVRHAEAAARAEAAGVTVIQDRCPRIERPRLF